MKEITLTPQQRIEAYQYVLDQVRAGEYRNWICLHLQNWIGINYHRQISTSTLLRLFPEFAEQKPIKLYDENQDVEGAWWNGLDREIRINVLQNAIKKCQEYETGRND